MEITKKELKTRISYLLLGFFTFYLVSPVREWVSTNLQINPIIFGIFGVLLSLYFFKY